MGKGMQPQSVAADVANLVDQLERHCLAPDASLVSKSSFYDLQLAREEMSSERLRYLEAMAIYCEAIAIVEEYQQTSSSIPNPQLGLKNAPQVYETLEHRLVVAEAAQKLRLPLISKDGEIHEDEIENWSVLSRSSLDSKSTSVTISSGSNSTNYASATSSIANNALSFNASDAREPEIGGVPNRYLGITFSYLWQTQLQRAPTSLSQDMSEYRILLSREIDACLREKCNKVADAFLMDAVDTSVNQNSSSRLPERVKLIIEEIERKEAALREDLYSADRKFPEYYNDEFQKIWLCKRCEAMGAKLRVLEHILLVATYTQETIPALHKIRKYLVEATDKASVAYNKAATRLREYKGVDPHFHPIARQ